MARALAFIKMCDLADSLAGRRWVSANVGPAGEAVLLLASDEDVPVFTGRFASEGGETFANSRTERDVAATVLLHDGNSSWTMELERVSLAYPHVQPLPDGEVLLVGTRCERYDDGT